MHKMFTQHLVDTIKMIQKKGAKAIILVSQRGHPDGQEIQWLGFEEIKTALETALDQVRKKKTNASLAQPNKTVKSKRRSLPIDSN